MIRVFPIAPVPAPRQTRADAFRKGRQMRPEVARYRAFRDEVALRQVSIPAVFHHIVFVLAVSKSWPEKQKRAQEGMPHQQRPDRDNLEKALLDAVLGQDCGVWDGRVTKVWGQMPMIIISTEPLPIVIPLNLDAFYLMAGYSGRI